MGGVSKLERYKNVVYLASSTSLMGIDLIKRREIHIHAFQSIVAGIHLYDPAEVSSVLGTAIVYEIAEVVDPQIHVVAKVPKPVLAALKVVE